MTTDVVPVTQGSVEIRFVQNNTSAKNGSRAAFIFGLIKSRLKIILERRLKSAYAFRT